MRLLEIWARMNQYPRPEHQRELNHDLTRGPYGSGKLPDFRRICYRSGILDETLAEAVAALKISGYELSRVLDAFTRKAAA